LKIDLFVMFSGNIVNYALDYNFVSNKMPLFK